MPTSRQDEAELRQLISDWSGALEARDVDRMMANYTSDALLFDVKPPYKVQGADAIRRDWENGLPHFPASFKSERRDLKLTVGGDLAFCEGLHRVTPTEPHSPAGSTGSTGSTWVRVTVCYRKIDGLWKVVHEHVSVPFDPKTGRAAFITDADVAAIRRP